MQVSDAMRGAPILLLLAAPVIWFGAQAVLSVVASPYRRRLHEGLEWLKAHSNLGDDEQRMLDHLWANAFSARAAIFISLAYADGLLMTREALVRERDCMAEAHPNLWRDPRMEDLMDWYFISTFAANPLFGLLALFLRIGFNVKLWLMRRGGRKSTHLRSIPPLEAAARV